MLEHERLKASFRKEQEQNVLIQRTVSALNHDLRNPLAVIATSKDILSRNFDQISAEKRSEKLDTIGRQLQIAIELLDDTVLLVQGNLSHRVFNPLPVNLATLCQISINEIRATYGRGHQLTFVNASEIAVASIDEILVSRILLNLLSNAVKYSPPGSEVLLSLRRRDEWIELEVQDHGIGISPQDLPHVFQPFFRSEDVHDIGGTGLGLSIVKDCVERHRGVIRLQSQLGVGTTFTVELPFVSE